jgi:branched-chain amino acid transport system ATP-binding protein
VYHPTEGRIFFNGENIGTKKSHYIAARGVARTFQTIHLFGELTVLDNALIGAHTQGTHNLTGAIAGFTPWMRREERALREWSRECLEWVQLEAKQDELARNLSYGEQRRLEIARALAVRPKLLLLDEPAAGMNPQEKKELMGLVKRIREAGITIFMVEHDMKLVVGGAKRPYGALHRQPGFCFGKRGGRPEWTRCGTGCQPGDP